jgi:uncharacterized protein (DUF1015 family)
LAEIKAFKGTFYNKNIVPDLARVTAPPYDVIDRQRQRDLELLSPHNIVRLILPQDESQRDFWHASSDLFNVWKAEGTLKADKGTFLYVYRQTFDLPGQGTIARTGITAALKCVDFSSGDILPHEKTFPRVHMERLNLLRACKANFSQIFTVFRDPGEDILTLLEDVVTGPAFIEFDDEKGTSHQLWRVEKEEIIKGMARVVSGQKLIIADGHHRYETALNYADEDVGIGQMNTARAFVSTTLFRSEDPGLTILPVHRMLRQLPCTVDEAHERIGRYFHLRAMEYDIGDPHQILQDRLKEKGRPVYVMITSRGVLMLQMREGVDPTKIIKGPQSNEWKSQDVSILHALIIGESLGMDADRLAEKGDLYFTPWERTALSEVESREAEAAFMVRPTRMNDIWRIAEGGERMPHKSTYFYPKLPSGLIIYDHESALAKG